VGSFLYIGLELNCTIVSQPTMHGQFSIHPIHSRSSWHIATFDEMISGLFSCSSLSAEIL